jgi:hypothetical protein
MRMSSLSYQEGHDVEMVGVEGGVRLDTNLISDHNSMEGI